MAENDPATTLQCLLWTPDKQKSWQYQQQQKIKNSEGCHWFFGGFMGVSYLGDTAHQMNDMFNSESDKPKGKTSSTFHNTGKEVHVACF